VVPLFVVLCTVGAALIWLKLRRSTRTDHLLTPGLKGKFLDEAVLFSAKDPSYSMSGL